MPTAIDVFVKVRGHERAEQLRAAREADLLPYFRRLESPAAPVGEMEGAERIMLGSNNYLGLTGDERVIAGAREALERYGTGLTGSRLLNGTIDLHLELEREIAEWMGAEDAIVFTTGHQANIGTLGTILGPGDPAIADSGGHARPTTAAGSWSWARACSRWRATSRRCTRSATSARPTAPA